MWFLSIDRKAGLGDAVPWILTDQEDVSSFWLEGEENLGLVETIKRRLALGRVRRLRSPSDLDIFRRHPELFDAGSNSVLFRASADWLRDKAFLRNVAETVSRMAGWYLVLEGSVLSHAPYQLRSFGARRLISLWEFDKPTKRTPIKKLVRDKIPERIAARGENAASVELPRAEFWGALRAKLVEEALEAFEAKDSQGTLSELADVLGVLRAIVVELGSTWETLEIAEAQKRADRGGFERRLFLESTAPEAEPAAQRRAGFEPRPAVRRLKSGDGLILSLVPPYRASMRRSITRIVIDETQLQIDVSYRGSEVLITFAPSKPSADPAQLSLFEPPKGRGVRRRPT
jgi:predicted house-cleaning noncanonical NTP pyrophosphatase (MazG superfamily)